MNGKLLTEYCLSKLGAVLEYPYGPQHPAAFKCGGKIFVVLLEKDGEAWLHLKFEPLFADLIREQYPTITGTYLRELEQSSPGRQRTCRRGNPADRSLIPTDISLSHKESTGSD